MGKEREADGPVFMQTHVHFTETVPRSFEHKVDRKWGWVQREEEAKSRAHHLSDPHAYTRLLGQRSLSLCDLRPFLPLFEKFPRPSHPSPPSRWATVDKTSTFD